MIVLELVFMVAGCTSNSTSTDGKVKENSDSESNGLITTTVANTEITDVLELDLIGVPETSEELPERYSGLPSVGDPHSPDPELLRSLNPKEVLSVSTIQYDTKEYFEQAGVNVRYLSSDSIDQMHEETLQLGRDDDRAEQANEIRQSSEKMREDTPGELHGKGGPKVWRSIGVRGSDLVGTESSYSGNLVEIAGGETVIKEEDQYFMSSNTDHLQQANPEIILRAAHGRP